MQLALDKSIKNACSCGYESDKRVVSGISSLGDVAKQFGAELRKDNQNSMSPIIMNKLSYTR